MPDSWSLAEVEATVADYFVMLTRELNRESVNKRDHNRALQRVLAVRSRGAIEFKHANISAVLIELGYPYIDGYKPRGNYQDLLREIVLARIETDHVLRAAAAAAVAESIAAVPDALAWEDVLVPPPVRERPSDRVYERRSAGGAIVKSVNYLEREARNRSLGAAGEEYVLRLEHARLWSAGARSLADRIEHSSRERGDGLGYDILSYETSGQERLIEVKRTRFGALTPFFASRNEVAVSAEAGPNYHLYRLYKFDARPKLFILPGSLEESVALDPVLYRASLA